MKYSEYTVSITREPEYYGSECSDADADRIADDLEAMIESEFPGIACVTYRDGQGSAGVIGPDDDVCEEIREWIQDNWTKAI